MTMTTKVRSRSSMKFGMQIQNDLADLSNCGQQGQAVSPDPYGSTVNIDLADMERDEDEDDVNAR